ncbi:acyltransferase family protein [Leptospira sp. WS92.C1]
MEKNIESKKEEILPLNGLRAFAIIVVFVYHYYFYSGSTLASTSSTLQYLISLVHNFEVNLFFILSGFLISMALWKEWQKNGRIRYLDFFLKRNYRLLPIYYLFITLSYFITRISYSISLKWIATKELSALDTLMALATLERTENQLSNAWADFVLLGNYWLGPNMHTWFLSVIEQFYIVFPFFCGWILFKKKFLTRQWILWGLYLIPGLFRIVIYLMPEFFGTDYEMLIFRPTHTRIDSILLGVIIMDWFVNREEQLRGIVSSRISNTFLIFIPILILFFINWKNEDIYSFFSGTIRFNLIDFAYGLILLSVILFPNSILGKSLSVKFLNPIANLSYTIYIWHLLISLFSFGVLRYLLPELFETSIFFFILSLFISFFVTLGVSWFIYRFIEDPLSRLFKRIVPPKAGG